MKKRGRRGLTIGALVLLAVLVAALWLLFFRDDAPEAVSTEAALEQIQEDLAADDETRKDPAADDEAQDAAPPPSGDDADTSVEAEPEPVDEPDGGPEAGQTPGDGLANSVWTVDDEFGDFDFETASGSFAGFRVDEELTIGDVTAVGRTGGVTGSLAIEDGTLVSADITVDMTTIESNDRRRENVIRDAVAADDFPTATFVLAEPVPLDIEALESGATIPVEVVGDLTVKGAANQVAFSLQATIVEPGIGLIIGSAEIFWADFGVDLPQAPIILSIDESGVLEFQLIVRPS